MRGERGALGGLFCSAKNVTGFQNLFFGDAFEMEPERPAGRRPHVKPEAGKSEIQGSFPFGYGVGMTTEGMTIGRVPEGQKQPVGEAGFSSPTGWFFALV